MRDIRKPFSRCSLPQYGHWHVGRIVVHDIRQILSTRKKQPASIPHVDEVSAPHRSGDLRKGARLKRPSRRKVFEALYRAQYLQAHARLPEALERDYRDDYAHSGVQIAWEIWQAAHAHAIELAAQHCEQRQAMNVKQDYKAIYRMCAEEIRALLSRSGSEDV
jgi:hypothetical protein